MRPSQQIPVILFLILLPIPGLAQRDTGSVSGPVYCADTQQPARTAHVVLVPLPPAATLNPRAQVTPPQPHAAETRMDGSFSIPRVPPGDYYVSVTYSGYLSPEYNFTENDLLHPTQELRRRIVESIPTVTVAEDIPSTISVVPEGHYTVRITEASDVVRQKFRCQISADRRALRNSLAKLCRLRSTNRSPGRYPPPHPNHPF